MLHIVTTNSKIPERLFVLITIISIVALVGIIGYGLISKDKMCGDSSAGSSDHWMGAYEGTTNIKSNDSLGSRISSMVDSSVTFLLSIPIMLVVLVALFPVALLQISFFGPYILFWLVYVPLVLYLLVRFVYTYKNYSKRQKRLKIVALVVLLIYVPSVLGMSIRFFGICMQ